MTNILLEIYAWYDRGERFEGYAISAYKDNQLVWSDPARGISELEDVVTRFFEWQPQIYGEDITLGNRQIKLVGGPHSLSNCRKGCAHIRYTQKPDDDFIKRLPQLLPEGFRFES